jgi:flagellar FliL protein
MADDNQEPKSSGNGKGLLIALIGLVVFLIFAVIGGGYFLYSHGLGNNGQQEHHEEVKKEESADKGLSFKADITDLVLNLTDSKGKEKLMKLSFSIKSTEPTIAALVEEVKSEIVDKVISQIGSRSSEELMTVGGKNLLKDELLVEINNIVNEAAAKKPEVSKNSVKQVLFTTFVIK